ncbi:divergent polysaccharide deacetylase family protein [Dehalobacterium formicoaceticum]|uniref:Divergent polysaccharide deacetylase family protein n=1 Tax=Dehalobacterium formicoaceticum TaxID=51515 RepID=A0ABT1Y7U6_9FIRM|nr:divergent polysaccharide deacetylase family protein [Dehalobacterium formicoaceticum]MCR6546638.1 divergent polysaccharide deacetylase family protein [Dehalobacterium formicoaceticum]
MGKQHGKKLFVACLVLCFIAVLTFIYYLPINYVKNVNKEEKTILLPLGQEKNGVNPINTNNRKAKVAIVIDDFGQFNQSGIEEMMSIRKPLTFAVMPNLEFSQIAANKGAKSGFEIIVHLPMEPKKGKSSWLGPGAIVSTMNTNQIKHRASLDLAAIPGAIGFNNHMGSLICSNENLIRPVLEAAKEKNFFVLDSGTDEHSLIIPLAHQMKIPCVKRDIFLDNDKSISHIKKQLDLLADRALTNGGAIGIGHVGLGGEKTAQALQEMIPIMENKGIEFVYLSELVK